jgi:hypothetical protein
MRAYAASESNHNGSRSAARERGAGRRLLDARERGAGRRLLDAQEWGHEEQNVALLSKCRTGARSSTSGAWPQCRTKAWSRTPTGSMRAHAATLFRRRAHTTSESRGAVAQGGRWRPWCLVVVAARVWGWGLGG